MTPVLNPQTLLNTLTNIYNSNTRQIEHLQQENMRIRNDITNILLRTINNTNTNNTNTNTNTNRRNNRINNFPQRENLSTIFNNISPNFFEPIQLFPTPTQIENATRIVQFANVVRPINNSCPITMDTFNDNTLVTVIRECNHIFNTDALNNWFRSNCRCPVCRYDIRNYNQNRNVNNITTNTDTNNMDIDTNNTDNNINTNNIIPNISNIQYDSNTDSIIFDITNQDFYNNLTRIAINRLNYLNNSNYDASGNNIYDASGNNIYDASGNNIQY